MGPANPHVRKLFRMVRPTDDGRGLAPTSATERGANRRSRRYVLIESVGRLAPYDARSRPFAQATTFGNVCQIRILAPITSRVRPTRRERCVTRPGRGVTHTRLAQRYALQSGIRPRRR